MQLIMLYLFRFNRVLPATTDSFLILAHSSDITHSYNLLELLSYAKTMLVHINHPFQPKLPIIPSHSLQHLPPGNGTAVVVARVLNRSSGRNREVNARLIRLSLAEPVPLDDLFIC